MDLVGGLHSRFSGAQIPAVGALPLQTQSGSQVSSRIYQATLMLCLLVVGHWEAQSKEEYGKAAFHTALCLGLSKCATCAHGAILGDSLRFGLTLDCFPQNVEWNEQL